MNLPAVVVKVLMLSAVKASASKLSEVKSLKAALLKV